MIRCGAMPALRFIGTVTGHESGPKNLQACTLEFTCMIFLHKCQYSIVKCRYADRHKICSCMMWSISSFSE